MSFAGSVGAFNRIPPYQPGYVMAYAQQQISAANNYMLTLGQLSREINPPAITPEFPTVGDAPALTVPTPPTFDNIVWASPNIPTPFTGTLDIGQYLPDPFDANPPVLSFGDAPAPFSANVPDAPGINTQFEYPDLTVNLPAPPSLLSISTSKFDGVTIPTLAEAVPTLNLVAPSIREYTPGAQYTSALLTSLKNTLQDRIDNGGTGLKPEIEEAIWNRGRDREYRQMRDALADLERMETLGFAFPPGVYVDARVKIQTEMGYNSANISREIMIEQAKLELQNVLKALDTATALEGNMLNYTNQVEQRLFESTRYATQAGVEIYNSQVRAYAAYVDAYKTKVAIYEAQIRGELAKVEAYKAEIDAEQAKAQINTALIAQYKTQADVALASIEVYKAQIAAIQTKAEIEKLKVQIFGEQVRAYGARVNAYTAGVEGFRATIQAEASKQDAFKSQVDAYTAQVNAAVRVSDAKIAEFKGRVDAKTAEWQAFTAQAEAEAARVRALSQSQTAEAEVYRSVVSGTASYNEVLTKQWQAAVEQKQRAAEIGVSAAKASSDLYLTTRGLALDAAKVGAQVSAQLGAAALNAVNWSNTTSNSSSYQSSLSQSINENYNYSASV